jgi:Mn-containing catalase
MFYHDSELQYEVTVEKPDPAFAKALQQAIGGVEGEIRVALQYLFQAFGARGPKKYRDLLMETGTEELGHIEMLATAVALNLEGADVATKEEMAQDSVVHAILSGKNPRHILSSGLGAMPVNSNGVPFDCSHVYATGNIAADMHANVTAEAGGRALACRLYNLTDDPGMKDMLSYLIARDTMHQNQWMAVIEEMGYEEAHPIPNSFPQEQENQEYSYGFMSTWRDGEGKEKVPQGRWTSGPSIDGKGEFSVTQQPGGGEPNLSPAKPHSGAQKEQMDGSKLSEAIDKAKEKVSS